MGGGLFRVMSLAKHTACSIRPMSVPFIKHRFCFTGDGMEDT